MKIPDIITGQEVIDDSSQPISALIAFYRAFNARNADAAAANWAKQYSIAMANPIGGIRRNWNAIREAYGKIMQADARVYVEYYDFKFHQFEDVFYAEGRERGSMVIGDFELGLKIRTTRIYKLFSDQWKQIHHHGSMDNPELLQRYQQAIMNVVK